MSRTRINKTSIPTLKATKGDDIWTRVKSKAAESAVMAASSINGLHPDDSTVQPEEDTVGDGTKYPLKQFGPNGEVVLVFENVVEIWDWQPSPNDTVVPTTKDTLFLVSQTEKFNGTIEMVALLQSDRLANKYSILVSTTQQGNDYVFQVVSLQNKSKQQTTNIVLPPSMNGASPYHCKVLQSHFIITTSLGSMSIFDKHDLVPIHQQQLNADLYCKLINGKPVWDSCGDWLVYNPMVQDYYYQKVIAGSYNITSLNLPKPGPLLNRVLKNLSSTAIDGAFKIAEISHAKLKNYINNSGGETESRNLRDTITKILNALNDTSSRQFLIVLSLTTAEPLFIFSPPGGCSTVSMSPCDLLLSTVTLRGDDIFIWDFTKFHKEISLIEKFKRGKTPGVVEQIVWYSQDKYIGVLSKLSGSLHWFQNNFLNEYGDKNSWTMSSFGFTNLQMYNDSILAFDNGDKLKIVDPKGTCNAVYELPQRAIPQNLLPLYLIKDGTTTTTTTATTPIATEPPPTPTPVKLELDYTLPYEFYYQNRKAEFYNKTSEKLDDWVFGPDDDDEMVTKIDFGRANGVAVFHENEELINTLLNE